MKTLKCNDENNSNASLVPSKGEKWEAKLAGLLLSDTLFHTSNKQDCNTFLTSQKLPVYTPKPSFIPFPFDPGTAAIEA
jgi:hypothetical protein